MNNLRNRKKRNIRRSLTGLVMLLVMIGAIIYNRINTDDLIQVRVSKIDTGDVSSFYYTTAEIKPGAIIEHETDVSQRIVEVLVEPHQQVQAGDVLAVLDQQELEDAYEAAREARREIEEAMAEADEEQAARMAAAEQSRRDLENEISRLSSSLSSAVSQLTRLAATEPASFQLDPELEENIARIIVNTEAETVEQDIETLLNVFRQSASIVENPEYTETLAQLERNLQAASSSAGVVLSGLASSSIAGSFALPDDLADQFGALAGIGSMIQDPLSQAVAQEEAARERLELSRPYIFAQSAGIIAQVNVKAGDYTGSVQIPSQSGLESLLGNSVTSLAQQSASAFTIYDNTQPKAVFLVSRFDANRLQTGMPVQYDYEGLTFNGEIINKGRIAAGGSASQLEGLDLFNDVSGGFSSEPQLEIKMDIRGSLLTDLVTGFWIEAEIEVARAENVLLIPADSMRRELDTYYVFLIDEQGMISRQPFTPGIQSESFVEVREGLQEGDTVVLSPPASLTEGMMVRVMQHE